jgi:hypothetical protein
VDEIVRELEWNAKGVRFGTVSVEVHIHDGRIVKTLYSTTKTKIGYAPAIGNTPPSLLEENQGDKDGKRDHV